ncbi:MAG: tRNA (adenosine(37)-N6)-threonylcarbamoyltransferase complex dimerization subunit type 1 TsaB, partial [Alphaproteobacteria bacterium]
MVKLLALDTATGACSVAIWHEGGVLRRRVAEMAHGHAEALMPMVREVMHAAGASFTDLDAFAVTVGPGAFTGLRIGLAAARGMALAA